MPIGSSETAAADRKVILVATDSRLRVLAATRAEWFDPFFINRLTIMKEALVQLLGKELPPPMALERLEVSLKLGIPISLHSPSEATRLFDFGVGHTPRDGSIYVQHPIQSDTYVLPNTFSRTLAKEKQAAFLQLASALGAKEVRFLSAKVHTKKGAAPLERVDTAMMSIT